MNNVFPGIEEARAAAEYLRSRTRISPSMGIVLGSGLGGFGERLTSREVYLYKDIPGFPVSTVPGHSGQLLIGYLKGRRLAVLQGRCHLYEGYTARQVAFPVRVLAELGIRVLIVTSAAGAVRDTFSPGEVMLVRDHLNFTGDTPLRGLREPGRSVFVDMSAAYDEKLMVLAGELAGGLSMSCRPGILASVLGPSYETPAEVAMLRSLGADAVCMSAVPEVIMARYLGLKILGFVLITNRAGDQSFSLPAPEKPKKGGHDRVLELASEKAGMVSALLERLVEAVGE